MDDHVGHSNIHLLGMTDVNTVEVSEPFLENLFSLVYSWVISDLYHPIVNLFGIHLIEDGIC